MQITGDWLTNKATQSVCHLLEEDGHLALFVGGCVRNTLLDAPVSDIDIATDARPETVIELARVKGLKTVPTGIEHGTVTIIARGIPHEVTTFRHDVETDGRRATIAFADDVADDARRRDFTMNALYADARGKVIDPLGTGLPDLAARKVRFIENAGERIREDYLRTLRFFRFHAWYGDAAGGLDAEGLAAIAENLDGLSRLSAERVGSEMLKLMAAPDPAPSVAAMRHAGVLARLLPGADDKALGPLVHIEQENGIAPDGLRRLAALGGDDVARRLRLSKKQARALAAFAEEIGTATTADALGYHYGLEIARDICLLRAALLEQPFPPDALIQAQRGAEARFPLKAADLPDLKGPEIGRRLKALEARWIASGFRLSRDELLATPDG